VAGDGGDEDGGGEGDAYGQLFGEAVVGGGGSGVDEEEPAEDQGAEYGVEAKGFERECGEERGDGEGGHEDSGEEGGGVAVVEEVAGFEVGGVEWVAEEGAGVEETGI
jgi:hypothetical protein